MTPELWWMTWTAFLAGALWIPFIVGVNASKAEGVPDFTRPGDPSTQKPWVHRAYRAHLNLLEQFLPMLALVLIAHAGGITSAVTIWATGIFFALRCAHAVGMISGLAGFPARPIIFTSGFACIAAVGVEIIRLG